MPFREKAKNLFKSSKTRSGSSSTSADSQTSNHDVYKPGETMPPPKYRRPPLKEHTEKLESFSFADAWRKRSFQSSHSPMGTAAHSRRPSIMSVGRRSRKSISGETGGRTASVSTQGSVGPGKGQDGFVSAAAPRLATELENEGDDDVANVGISQVQSRENASASRPRTAEGGQLPPSSLHKTMSTAHDHQPFSEQDVANALHRARLQVPAH